MTDPAPRSRRPAKLSPKTTAIVIGLLVGYVLLQPSLERWTGMELPSLTGNDPVAPQQVPPVSDGLEATALDNDDKTSSPDEQWAPIVVPGHGESATSRERPASTETATIAAPAADSGSTKPSSPKLGELRDVGGGTFQSTAGLTYRRGSQEGHRINHILRHHQDDFDRPVHGVFDGDRNEVFAVIDEAYLYTFDHGPPRVEIEEDDGRKIYVVDLGRRIGYVGGEKGQRTNHPPANHLQLILDGTNVITAYPVRVDRRR